MKTLYLHVGYPKTATSSIQTTLFKNHEILKEINYLYPIPFDGSSSHNRTIPIVFRDIKKPMHRFFIKKKKTVDEMNTLTKKGINKIIGDVNESNHKNVILSGEWIIALTKEGLDDLQEFIKLKLNITKIIVVVSVREVVSRAISGIQQEAQAGKVKSKIKVKNIFLEKLSTLIDVFGRENLKVYKFEDACRHSFGPVGYFCEQIGISKESIEELNIVKTNEGVSNKSVDLLQFINKKIPLIQEGVVAKERSDVDTKALQIIRGEKFILPVNLQEKLILESKDDRKWLKENFAIDYEDTKIQEPLEIIYDEAYYEDIIAVYGNLSPTIQDLVHKYLKNKSSQTEDKVSQNTLNKLIKWIKKFDNSPMEIFDLFKGEEFPTGVSVYREIALMSEKDNNIEVALYFMEKAKILKTNGTLINKKIEEYKAILKESKKV